ncbi:MAG: sulfite exporter TauE/SafE family protein, partial [Syntrophales bacterium]|nr:sulfite exporter TauE/SafE family protein [Syntrophales bacterium]
LQPWSKERIKATLQGYYFCSGLLVVASQAAAGLMGEEVWRLFVQALPALFLGTYGGHFFFGKVREELYRRVILILLFCLGVFTIIQAR